MTQITSVTFSAKTLAVTRRLGTTSSHSKGNIMTVNAKGEFVALDLGDNYPRGVHLQDMEAIIRGHGAPDPD